MAAISPAEARLLHASVVGDWAACRAAATAHRDAQGARLFDPNAAALQHGGVRAIIALHEGTATPVGVEQHMEWPLPSMGFSAFAWAAAAYARAGEGWAAIDLLDRPDWTVFADLERDGYFLPTLAMLADAAHRLGHRGIARLVAERIEPFVACTILDPGLLYRGAASHAAGLAAATLGDCTAATELLRDAVDRHRAHGSTWMLQRSLDALTDVDAPSPEVS